MSPAGWPGTIRQCHGLPKGFSNPYEGAILLKLHIDTAPVWEAYREDCECPLCLLYNRVEADGVSYFLGESVMEPSQRIEVNQKGFCAKHFKQMYDVGNRLGLALMTHTHMKETLRRQRELAERLKDSAREEAARPAIGRLVRRKGVPTIAEEARAFKSLDESCALCERIDNSMRRYIHTILYMYGHEADFPGLFRASKGMCLKHYGETLAMAQAELGGQTLETFVNDITDIEIKNFERLEGEIDWFTRKFDYRNADKPWGNSKDAVKRSINKLRTHIIDD